MVEPMTERVRKGEGEALSEEGVSMETEVRTMCGTW